MRRSTPLVGLVCASSIAAVLSACGSARGGPLSDYSLFGAGGVNLQGATVNGGIAASNGDFSVGNFASFTNLAGGGSLFAQGPTVTGNVTFNGNIFLGGANVAGAVNGGGNVSIDTFGQVHDVTARGNVTFNGSSVAGNVVAGNNFNGLSGTVNGNVAAGNNAALASFAGTTVNGNLTYGNALLTGGNPPSVKGTVSRGAVAANPTPYAPITLPPGATFTAGGPDLTSAGSATSPLAPGRYGNVNLPVFKDLYLGPGNYFFSSLTLLNSSIHLVGLTAQNSINVFVAGDITEGGLSGVTVNGQPYNSVDPTLARNVLFQTDGNFIQGGGGDNFFGTIFAPDGDVQLGGFANVIGSVLAGGSVTDGGSVTVNFQASASPFLNVPEPPALALTAIGLLSAAGAFARRRLPTAPR